MNNVVLLAVMLFWPKSFFKTKEINLICNDQRRPQRSKISDIIPIGVLGCHDRYTRYSAEGQRAIKHHFE